MSITDRRYQKVVISKAIYAWAPEGDGDLTPSAELEIKEQWFAKSPSSLTNVRFSWATQPKHSEARGDERINPL